MPAAVSPTPAAAALLQEATLQVKASPNTFALGDVSMSEVYDSSAGAAFPATAQVAFQQADYVAWNLWAAINGRPQLPFRCALGPLATRQHAVSGMRWSQLLRTMILLWYQAHVLGCAAGRRLMSAGLHLNDNRSPPWTTPAALHPPRCDSPLPLSAKPPPHPFSAPVVSSDTDDKGACPGGRTC